MFLLSLLLILGFDIYQPIIGTIIVLSSSLFILNKIIKTKSKSNIAYDIFVIAINIAITKASIGYYTSGYFVNSILGYKMDHSLAMVILLGMVVLLVVVLKARIK